MTLNVRDDEELEGTYSTIIDVEPDYTIYFVIGGVLIAAAFAVVIIMRRRKLS